MAVTRTVPPRRLALQLLAGLLAVALLHPPGAFPEDSRVTVRASRALDPPPLPNRPLPGGRGGKECAASLRAEQRLAPGGGAPCPGKPSGRSPCPEAMKYHAPSCSTVSQPPPVNKSTRFVTLSRCV